MQTEFHHNYTSEELYRRLSYFSDGEKPSAFFKLVYTKNNSGQWGFLIGNCTLGREGDEFQEIYSEFAFVNKSIQDIDIKGLIGAIDKIGNDLNGQYSGVIPNDRTNFSCTEYVIPSYRAEGLFPLRRFSIPLTRSAQFINTKLVGYGLPYRSSARQYIKEFLNLNRYHGESDGDNGSLSICIEDSRGHIFVNDNEVYFQSENPDLMLVGQLSDTEILSIKNGEIHTFDKIDVDASELWLIDKHNELIDFISGSHWYFKSAISENIDATENGYITLIDKGENHTCEFKPYIDLSGKKNTKAEQIERTVCAFSNAVGGKLLIGVSDDGVIEGVNEGVIKEYRHPIDTALEQYTKAIRKRLNEKLRDGQCTDLKTVKIGDRFIIEVDTIRSKDVNYYLESKQGFMRRGSTSAKIAAADEREKIFEKPT